DLSVNSLRDLALPASLGKLRALNVSDNSLTNITFPAGMTNFTDLNLNGNQLSNLTLPPGVNQLTALNLSWNQLTDLSFLTGLHHLITLGLGISGDQPKLGSVLQELSNLTDLAINGFYELGPRIDTPSLASGLNHLTSLEISWAGLN